MTVISVNIEAGRVISKLLSLNNKPKYLIYLYIEGLCHIAYRYGKKYVSYYLIVLKKKEILF